MPDTEVNICNLSDDLFQDIYSFVSGSLYYYMQLSLRALFFIECLYCASLIFRTETIYRLTTVAGTAARS